MISTNDKNLAIQMWQEVRDKVEEEERAGKAFYGIDIDNLKMSFCLEHKIHWLCNCILCEEYRRNNYTPCSHDCPLMNRVLAKGFEISCGCSDKYETDFAVAMDENREYSLEERLKAIDNIINAIQEVQAVD